MREPSDIAHIVLLLVAELGAVAFAVGVAILLAGITTGVL